MRSKRRWSVHPLAVVVWVLFLGTLLVVPRLVPDEEVVRTMLQELGLLAPVAYVVAEAVQVVIFPIPGQPIEIPGGFLFGLIPGTLLGTLGASIGSMIAFVAGRRWGRPWVDARIAEETRVRFAGWLDRGQRAEWIIFWLMLVPAFPRDPLCYLAGLTALSPMRFLVITLIGRPIGMAPWVALGAEGVASGVVVQLWLLGVAGVIWLLHVLYVRFLGARAPEPPDTLSASPNGETHA